MNELSELIERARNDSSLLMELTSEYINFAASSNLSRTSNHQETVVEVLTKHKGSSPFSDTLIELINGISYFYSTSYEKALASLQLSKKLFTKGMPIDILGSIHMYLGAIYRSLGKIDIAVENQFLAKNILNKNGLFAITYAYANYQLGEIHVSLKEYDNAKSYYEEALEVISKFENTTANFRINDGLGVFYQHLKQYDLSLEFFNKALSIKEISSAEKARALCDIGVNYLFQANYEKAKGFLEDSYELRKEHNLKDASSTSLLYLGEVFIQTNSLNKAIEVLKEAESISSEFNAANKKIKIYRLLAQAYERNNNINKALNYYSKYDVLNNKFRAEQEHKIFRLKNKQIETQKQRLEEKNIELNSTLDELAKVKTSRKSLFFSVGTAITLVILTEAFFDPLIDSYAYNVYLSLGVKVIIALMLKPMESFYERILLRRALKLK